MKSAGYTYLAMHLDIEAILSRGITFQPTLLDIQCFLS